MHQPSSLADGLIDFYQDRFVIKRGVLLPRYDSESVVQTLEYILNGGISGKRLPVCISQGHLLLYRPKASLQKKYLRLLEVGCGSGVLAISCVKYLSQVSCGFGVDINSSAVQLSITNARRLLTNVQKMKFIKQDVRYLSDSNFYDIIISNPPYIGTKEVLNLEQSVRVFDPCSALFSGVDGLDLYNVIALKARLVLKKNGIVLVEIGYRQERSVIKIFKNLGFVCATKTKDIHGIVRVLSFCRNF